MWVRCKGVKDETIELALPLKVRGLGGVMLFIDT